MKSDSYGQVTLTFYIKMVKGILALSPTLLGAPTKLLGAQSKTNFSIGVFLQTISQNGVVCIDFPMGDCFVHGKGHHACMARCMAIWHVVVAKGHRLWCRGQGFVQRAEGADFNGGHGLCWCRHHGWRFVEHKSPLTLAICVVVCL